MVFLSTTMPSAALAPAAVSHRRCIAVVASARSTCVAASAALQRKTFQSNHGISLLRSKPAAQRTTVGKQVDCVDLQHVEDLKLTPYKVGFAGVCKGWRPRRNNGQRSSLTEVRLGATSAVKEATEATESDTACVQASWLDQLLGPACIVNSLCDYPLLCCIVIHAGKFLLW